jgi:glycyl-tRNA synthetase (class II)
METKTTAVVNAETILTQLEQIRTVIRTKEHAGNWLTFAKKLKQFSEEVEKKVKARASEIMFDEDLKEIEANGFVITKIDATETREYDPKVVIDAIGIERALGVGIKISTSKLEKYIQKRGVSMDELRKINEGVKVKHRSGYIAIKSKKNEKES